MNLSAGVGTAVREFPLKSGFADYLLYVDRKAIGVVEAKPAGYTLTGVETQSAKYVDGLPDQVPHFRLPLPFAYESTGVVTQFTNRLNPEPRSREVFSFHRPEELRRLVNLGDDQLRANLRNMPEFNTTGLWKVQAEAIEGLEQSFADNRPRSLIQMATGSGKTYTACSFSYRLIKYAKAKRILFLVDRNNLGRQALNEFQQYASPYTNYKFSEEFNVQHLKKNTIDPAAKVCITTLPTSKSKKGRLMAHGRYGVYFAVLSSKRAPPLRTHVGARCTTKGRASFVDHRAWQERLLLFLLREQLGDVFSHDLLAAGSLPIQFAVPPVADVALLIDQVHAGPHRVSPDVPILFVVVDDDGEVYLVFFCLLPNALDVALGRRFRRVDADDRQAVSEKIIVPFPVPGVIADAVNSPKRIKVNRHHPPAQILDFQRSRVDPVFRARDFRSFERQSLAESRRVDRFAQHGRPLVPLVSGQGRQNRPFLVATASCQPTVDRFARLAALSLFLQLADGLVGLLENLLNSFDLVVYQFQLGGDVRTQDCSAALVLEHNLFQSRSLAHRKDFAHSVFRLRDQLLQFSRSFFERLVANYPEWPVQFVRQLSNRSDLFILHAKFEVHGRIANQKQVRVDPGRNLPVRFLSILPPNECRCDMD